jgi:hypothetical protein
MKSAGGAAVWGGPECRPTLVDPPNVLPHSTATTWFSWVFG